MAKEVPLKSLTTQAHPLPFLHITTAQITYPLSTVTCLTTAPVSKNTRPGLTGERP